MTSSKLDKRDSIDKKKSSDIDKVTPRSASVPDKSKRKKDIFKEKETHLKKKKDPSSGRSDSWDSEDSHESEEWEPMLDLPEGESIYKGWRVSAGKGASDEGFYDPKDNQAQMVLPDLIPAYGRQRLIWKYVREIMEFNRNNPAKMMSCINLMQIGAQLDTQ